MLAAVVGKAQVDITESAVQRLLGVMGIFEEELEMSKEVGVVAS